MKHIAVIGEGAWGMAIAQTIAGNGYPVHLWCQDASVACQINQEHKNDRYMPGATFFPQIIAFNDLEKALRGVEWVFITTPIKYLRETVEACKSHYRQNQRWVILSKGIEIDTLMLPEQVVSHILSPFLHYVVLGGPSFARDLIDQKLTGVALAAKVASVAEDAVTILKNDFFKPFIINDHNGIQLGGALKNIVAVLMGCVYQQAENTRAFIFTRAWQEMCALARALGAQDQTIMGLAGIGDLYLTVSSNTSRNFRTGTLIAQGKKQFEIEDELGAISEGLNTLKSVHQIIEKYSLILPLFQALSKIVFEEGSLDLLIQAIVYEEAPQGR